MFVVKYRKAFYLFSGILVAASIVALSMWGLKLGIDFKGGSLVEVQYSTARPGIDAVNAALKTLDLGDFSARPSGEQDYIIRTETVDQTKHDAILSALTGLSTASSTVKETQFDSIGPILSSEATNKSVVSVLLVILAIVLFITFAFRKVSEPVSSWKYGLIAIVSLVHNVIIPVGIFAVLGHFLGTEIDTLFMTALLVILGFSIHDNIVVFDRVRENLRTNRSAKKPFEEIVGESIAQTFTRSINTSLTVLFSLLVLYIVGAEATRDFILALLVGIFAGTYSSIFIGSPLLVTVEKWQRKRAEKRG